MARRLSHQVRKVIADYPYSYRTSRRLGALIAERYRRERLAVQSDVFKPTGYGDFYARIGESIFWVQPDGTGKWCWHESVLGAGGDEGVYHRVDGDDWNGSLRQAIARATVKTRSPWRLKVTLCVNDDRGNLSDRCCQIEIRQPGQLEPEVKLELDADDGAGFRRTETGFALEETEFQSFGWSNWVGNIFWESTETSVADARRLVQRAKELHFTATEYSLDGPLADLLNAHETEAA